MKRNVEQVLIFIKANLFFVTKTTFTFHQVTVLPYGQTSSQESAIEVIQ